MSPTVPRHESNSGFLLIFRNAVRPSMYVANGCPTATGVVYSHNTAFLPKYLFQAPRRFSALTQQEKNNLYQITLMESIHPDVGIVLDANADSVYLRGHYVSLVVSRNQRSEFF